MSGAPNEEWLAAALARAQAANAELEQFVYVVSHDLQAPVRGIANLATWLLEDHADAVGDPEARRLLDLLDVRVRNLSRMIEGLLRYSRAGSSDLEMGEVRPAEVVRRALADIAVDGVVLDMQLADGATTTSARVLREAVEQLVDNAVRAARQGGGHVRVALALDAASIRLTVSDDGPGVAEHMRDRLFRVFETGEPASDRQRAGVGLAILQKLAARVGGRVWFAPAAGQGSTFSVEWPRGRPGDINTGEEHP
jgi:signal transduction histidine kinase